MLDALQIATINNMKQTPTFAFIYNALGVPLDAGVLCPLTGWLLFPMIAALAMSRSAVSVISNALRLRGAKLPTEVPETEKKGAPTVAGQATAR